MGWGAWTVWSECDENGNQHRRRSCATPGPNACQGHDFETRICVGGIRNGKEDINIISNIKIIVAFLILS